MKFKLLSCLLFCIFSLSAQQSVRVKLEKERLAISAEIEKTNQLLSKNTKITSDALIRLDLLARQIDSRKKVIDLLNQEIASLDNEIDSKESQTQSLEKDLEAKKQQYAASIRKMYFHKNNQDNLLFILSSQNFAQSFHRAIYLKAYSGWQKKQAEKITEKQKVLDNDKKLLVAQRGDKLNLLDTRQSEENKLTKEEESKKAEVKTLVKNRKKLQANLAKQEKQAKALNQQFEKFIAAEVVKSEKQAKSKSSVIRTTDEKGGYAMTESERTLSSTFAGNKGKLPYPVSGKYRIVRYFGVNKHKEFHEIVTKNNGIDIETTPGNEARSVFNGVVSHIFILPGYDYSIIIRHGNYRTFYSNIDQVYVKQGDNVTTGQVIGKIYTGGADGNPTLLHFEIWKEQTKLDPLAWIK